MLLRTKSPFPRQTQPLFTLRVKQLSILNTINETMLNCDIRGVLQRYSNYPPRADQNLLVKGSIQNVLAGEDDAVSQFGIANKIMFKQANRKQTKRQERKSKEEAEILRKEQWTKKKHEPAPVSNVSSRRLRATTSKRSPKKQAVDGCKYQHQTQRHE